MYKAIGSHMYKLSAAYQVLKLPENTFLCVYVLMHRQKSEKTEIENVFILSIIFSDNHRKCNEKICSPGQ